MSSVQNDGSVTKAVNTKKNNRSSFFIMLGVFALPIILAKLALDGEWLAMGVTNKGTLLTNELTLAKLEIDVKELHQQWLILYNLPKKCDENCQNVLESVHNTYVAIGKDMPRVTPIALYQETLSADQLQHLSKSQWLLMEMSPKAKEYLSQPQISIVDPMGNIFLSHKLPDDVEQLPQFGKQILADMKKLLKYSKVG